MKLWNRVFLTEPGRQGEASAALVAAHEAINDMSDSPWQQHMYSLTVSLVLRKLLSLS